MKLISGARCCFVLLSFLVASNLQGCGDSKAGGAATRGGGTATKQSNATAAPAAKWSGQAMQSPPVPSPPAKMQSPPSPPAPTPAPSPKPEPEPEPEPQAMSPP